jgi:hypothetical protein
MIIMCLCAAGPMMMSACSACSALWSGAWARVPGCVVIVDAMSLCGLDVLLLSVLLLVRVTSSAIVKLMVRLAMRFGDACLMGSGDLLVRECVASSGSVWRVQGVCGEFRECVASSGSVWRAQGVYSDPDEHCARQSLPGSWRARGPAGTCLSHSAGACLPPMLLTRGLRRQMCGAEGLAAAACSQVWQATWLAALYIVVGMSVVCD